MAPLTQERQSYTQGMVTTVRSRDPSLQGKRTSKYARGFITLQDHLGNENRTEEDEDEVDFAAKKQAFLSFEFARFGTVDRLGAP